MISFRGICTESEYLSPGNGAAELIEEAEVFLLDIDGTVADFEELYRELYSTAASSYLEDKGINVKQNELCLKLEEYMEEDEYQNSKGIRGVHKKSFLLSCALSDACSEYKGISLQDARKISRNLKLPGELEEKLEGADITVKAIFYENLKLERELIEKDAVEIYKNYEGLKKERIGYEAENYIFPNFLLFLRETEKPVVLVTGSPKTTAEAVKKVFEKYTPGSVLGVVAREDVKNEKPHPESYKKALKIAAKKLKITTRKLRKKILCAEDSFQGIESLKRAKIPEDRIIKVEGDRTWKSFYNSLFSQSLLSPRQEGRLPEQP